MMSCVSMKKFSSVEKAYANLKNDSVALSSQIKEQSDRIDDLTRRTISLGIDSLRLYGEYTALLEKYKNDIEENRQEIARLNAHLYGTSKRNYNNSANSSTSRILKIFNSLSKSMNTFAKEISNTLFHYNKSLYSIENRNWELSIVLRDSLLFPAVDDNGKIAYDHRRLTRDGEIVLAKIASMIVEKDNFDVVVREYININSPNLSYIPSAKIDEVNISKNEITAIIDTILYVNQNISSKPKDSAAGNAVIDIAQSNRIDSLKALQEAERIKNKEIERLATIAKEKDRAYRKAADRTSVVMRTLMKNCYYNMGSNKISRDVSYIKSGGVVKEQELGWVEIIFRPNLSGLYDLIQELEKRQNNK